MSDTYTLTEHSGLGPAAVESCRVSSAADRRAITAAGGVLLPGYAVAEDVAELMLRYASAAAIAPCGVAGSFAPIRVRGLRLWLPDAWATTLIRLGDDCAWQLSLADLVAVTDGVLSPAVV